MTRRQHAASVRFAADALRTTPCCVHSGAILLSVQCDKLAMFPLRCRYKRPSQSFGFGYMHNTGLRGKCHCNHRHPNYLIPQCRISRKHSIGTGWLGSRVVSVLDSGGRGFKSQSRRCLVTVLGKLFIPITRLRLCSPSSEIGSSPLKGGEGNCRSGGK